MMNWRNCLAIADYSLTTIKILTSCPSSTYDGTLVIVQEELIDAQAVNDVLSVKLLATFVLLPEDLLKHLDGLYTSC